MKEYLDTDFIFYGSIKRLDYLENNSDIDIAILTDNPTSMLAKIKNYLNIKNGKIKKIYQTFNNNSSLINGYKFTYTDEENNWGFDVVIYDEIYRDIIIKDIYFSYAYKSLEGRDLEGNLIKIIYLLLIRSK
jgi:predicted nucleotidyltransferase